MAVRTVVGGAVAALLLLASPAAAGGPKYRLTTVMESTCDPGVPPFECPATSISPFGFRCPAINSRGVVAVTAQTNGDFETSPLTQIVTVTNGVRTVVADTRRENGYPTTCDNGFSSITSKPSLNELGEVSFQGNLRRQTGCPSTPGQQRQGIFLGKGGPLTTISHTINGPEANFSEYLVADSTCNSSGRVTIVPEIQGTFDQGLFTGDRAGSIQKRFLVNDTNTDFRGTSDRPSINELNQIAFQSVKRADGAPTGVQGIFLSNPNGTFSTVIDSSSGEFNAFFNPSLNIFGRVAFQGFKTVAGAQVVGIYTARNGNASTVADNSGRFGSRRAFSGFQEPSLNDFGGVAFTADTNKFCTPEDFSFEQGVYTGNDPVADKVLSTCDTYAGMQITSVNTCFEGLNNSGEIVMVVSSQSFDPETFTFPTKSWVVKATPTDGPRD